MIPSSCGGIATKLHVRHLAVVGVMAAGLGVPASGLPAQQTTVAIVGATIIDGNGGPPVENGTLVVTGNRITAVGPAASVTVPPGARVIDGAGKFVTPGFIDTNVHLTLYGPGQALERYETAVRYKDRNADLALEAGQMQLRYGFTTVRDSYGALGPLVQIRDAIERGDTVGPRMLVAGNIVGWGGPYSVTFALIKPQNLTRFQRDFNDYITHGSGEELMNMELPELRQAINVYLDQGPNFIKYGGTTHFENPVLIGFSPDQQQAIVEETHKRGLSAETHATNFEGLRIAIRAGLDLVQHPELLPAVIPDDLVKMFIDRGVICSFLASTITGDPWERYLEEEAERGRQAEERGEKLAPTPGSLAVRRRNAEKLIAAGCISTVGTDNYLGAAPEFRSSPKPPNQSFGIGSALGAIGLVDLGMTPLQAITAITKNGAMACKMLDRIGTLETGKLADIVILGADPLENIENIRAVDSVIRDGKVVHLDALPYQRIFSKEGHGHAW